jgi:FkbM family methyltransferase
MLRQISNLVHTGRFRTTLSTPRTRKPAFLRHHPSLEIHNLLEMAIAQQTVSCDDVFFIQIGAFDGREGDHLHQLIRTHHWRGVLVEPQPQAFELLQRNYAGQSQLQFFNVAIGPRDGTLTLYTRTGGCVPIASVSRRLLVKPGHSRSEVVAIEVPCWTIQRLLSESASPERIDLLQIDTEGFDFEIIRSIQFERVKPSIIRFEHALLSDRDRNDSLELLAEHGYRFVLEDRDTMALLDGASRG